MKKLFVLVSLFVFSLLLGIKGSASDYYELGTHLEAEKYNVNNLTVINSNPNASGYKALDAGASGSVTYDLNIKNAGNYRLALGYYSGGVKGKAALKVNVNGKEEVYQITTFNGWCKDTNRLPIAYSVDIYLNEGQNQIIYGAAGEYVNLDYIAIYDVNAEYSQEEMYANLWADGSRIQAEWAVDVVGDFCDKNIAIKEKGSCTDGFTFSVDDDYLSKPGYVVNATSGGTYVFQVAFYGANSVTPKYLFNVNGNDYLITLPKSPANWNRDSYSTKASFEVELVEGKNVIYYSYAKSGFADFDWFRLYKKDSVSLNEVIEAEDYILGDVNAIKSSSKYSFVSNYVVELAQGSVDFEVSVDSAGSYVLYVSSYTGTNGAYQYININGKCTIENTMINPYQRLSIYAKELIIKDMDINNPFKYVIDNLCIFLGADKKLEINNSFIGKIKEKTNISLYGTKQIEIYNSKIAGEVVECKTQKLISGKKSTIEGNKKVDLKINDFYQINIISPTINYNGNIINNKNKYIKLNKIKDKLKLKRFELIELLKEIKSECEITNREKIEEYSTNLNKEAIIKVLKK